ncbi:MAG TPA: YdeI/OmpD-associated family protein [Gemmatimonadales bacterium]|nr:YdeI/OmpD-associated family protein [Gemmatimonadales bacterium]
MGTRDPRVDAYIARSAEFARPILTRLREIIHEACPEAEETIKWGVPHFMDQGILCATAGFKAHCRLILPRARAAELDRIESLKDLPPRSALIRSLREAMAQLHEGKPARPRRPPRAAPATPDDLLRALRKNARARATFEGFSPSQKREYVDWISEAKRDETRARRVETAVQWISEGKQRNWKYQRPRAGASKGA